MHFVAMLVGHHLSFLPNLRSDRSRLFPLSGPGSRTGHRSSEPVEVVLNSDSGTLKVTIASLAARLTLGQ